MSGEKSPDIMSGNFFPDIIVFLIENPYVGEKISRQNVGKIFSRHSMSGVAPPSLYFANFDVFT